MASSTAQDRKTKTLPLQTHEAPQGAAGSSEEPFGRAVHDGEIIDEDSPFTAGRSAGDSSPRTGQRVGDRGRRRDERERNLNEKWDARRADAGLPPSGPATHPARPAPRTAQEHAAALREAVHAAGQNYLAELEKAEIMAAKKTPKERASQLTGIHKSYVSMMVLNCLKPLSEGVSAKSVLSVVGMGSALWMLSPNFRDQVGDFRDQMKEAITAKIDERRQSRLDKVVSDAAEQTAAGVPLSQKWQEKLDRAERAKRGGRDAYTAQSAGMTEVALAEAAYKAMRVQGADVEGLRDTYDSLINTLYAQAQEDGVGAEEVAMAARVVVGLRMQEEPGLATVFGELSHGQFAKSAPREVRLNGTDETAWVWTGEFESRLGQQVKSGSFAVRKPMTADQHQAAIADTMAADMIALTRNEGAAGLNKGVVGYAAAWGLRGRLDFGRLASMDNPLGERLRTSQLMMGSMGEDFISAEEQQRIYSNAYVDAMENVSALYPDVEEEWGAKFGTNWRENMRSFVSDPESYMGANGTGNTRREPSPAWEAGPARPSTKYRNARINQNYIATAETGLTGFGSDSSDFRDPGFDLGG